MKPDLKQRLQRLRRDLPEQARRRANRLAADWRRISPFEHPAARRPAPAAATASEAVQTRRAWRPGRVGAVAGVVALAVVVFLALFDWNMLRGPIGRYASARAGRTVVLEGDLKVKLLTLTPRVEIGGLTISNPDWGPKENMAEVGNITVAARLLPLLTGRLVLPLVDVDHPAVGLIRAADGRANWTFSNDKPTQPMKLPPIQNFVIRDGKLSLSDLGRGLAFNGVINAREQRTAAYARGFTLKGDGVLNRRNFQLNVVGGPLINVRRDRPYPFDAEVRAGATRVLAKGQVPRPFDLGVVEGDVQLSGADLNDLYYLTGLALPNTAPYSVRGRLRRDDLVYRYTGFSGRVGQSDLSGDATVDLRGERPFVRASLNSKLLDFADLAGLFGAPGASAAATPAQKAEVRQMAAQGRLLPDATLQVDRIRAMDAEVDYRAASVRAPNLPLRGVQLGAHLKDGVLTLDPVAFDFPTGRLTGEATIDARKDVPVSKVDFRLSNIKLEEFIPPVSGARPVYGTLLGRARLTGSGNSVHKAADSSNGAVSLVVPGGRIRQAFAELMGINAAKGLFMLITGDQDPTDIRCAVADFQVRGGVMYARKIVFDTGVVLVNGEGTVDLGRETYDLKFKGHPKKFRVIRLIAPITMDGRLRAPHYGIEAGGVVAQAGIGAALGALLTPLAAILPFVDPGLAKNADCRSLLAEQAQGAAPPPGSKAAAAAEPGVKAAG